MQGEKPGQAAGFCKKENGAQAEEELSTREGALGQEEWLQPVPPTVPEQEEVCRVFLSPEPAGKGRAPAPTLPAPPPGRARRC